MPNKIEIGPVNLTKKIFKNFVTVFSLIRYYLPLEKTGSSIWSTCLEFYKNAISFILRYDALFVCFFYHFLSVEQAEMRSYFDKKYLIYAVAHVLCFSKNE